MAVMPVMVAVPMTMPVMVPMAMVVPTYFFRFDAIDVVLRYDGGLSNDGCGSSLQCTRNRRKRCGLCACGEHHTTRHKSNREFRNVSAFHDFSPFLEMEREPTVSPPQDECSLNSSTITSTGYEIWFKHSRRKKHQRAPPVIAR